MRTVLAGCLALAVASSGVTAELSAQIPADRTYLEFTSPVRIPGATLAPGMYLFVIGRPVGDQSIIDVYSSDGSRLIATCLGVDSTLPRPSSRTTVDFPRVSPSTLRAWFNAASAYGMEFVYGQTEAKALFSETGLAVPYTSFKTGSRDLVGAFPVRRVTPLPLVGVANAAAMVPTAAGTAGVTGLFEPFDDSLGPHDHLTSARRLIAERAAELPPQSKAMLETLGRQVSQMQAAFRKGDRKEVDEWLRLVDKMIYNLLPNEDLIIARRQQRLPREIIVVLERVQAHVKAFRDLPSPSLQLSRK
jgi:hypothetical protein